MIYSAVVDVTDTRFTCQLVFFQPRWVFPQRVVALAAHVRMTVGLHVLNVGEMRLIQIDVHGVIVLAQRSSNELDRLRTQIIDYDIGLYRDVWIAAIASSTTSLATRTAAICVRFQGRRVRRAYVTMQITMIIKHFIQ